MTASDTPAASPDGDPPAAWPANDNERAACWRAIEAVAECFSPDAEVTPARSTEFYIEVVLAVRAALASPQPAPADPPIFEFSPGAFMDVAQANTPVDLVAARLGRQRATIRPGMTLAEHIAASIDWTPTCEPGGERAAIVRQILAIDDAMADDEPSADVVARGLRGL